MAHTEAQRHREEHRSVPLFSREVREVGEHFFRSHTAGKVLQDVCDR
jgi:hypothetical protein